MKASVPMATVKFTKMQGIGNDFIVIDDRESLIHLSKEQVIELCDRRFGIGADGVMLIRPATHPDADYSWWFVNNDGSVPEMCGNGSRCFARYVYEHGLLPDGATSFVLETLCGLKKIDIVTHSDGTFKAARVNMGTAVSLASAIPTTLENNAEGQATGLALTATNGAELIVSCVNIGNPHTILFTDENQNITGDENFFTLGPAIESDPHFPQKTNVEFIEPLDSSTIRMRVWERGCGETLACGTGACASAFASYLTGRTGDDVTVHLKGGDLRVEIAQNHEIFMTGEAENVFEGTFDATMNTEQAEN